MQEGRQAARAEKKAAIREGKAKSDRTNEQRKEGRAFAKQMQARSAFVSLP